MSTRTHFEKTVLLTAGQVASLGITFLIPICLSRWLTVDGYGTYKQLMLFHALLLLTVHMGMDWGLFYFIKRDPERAANFSLNVMLVDLILASVVCLAGILGRGALAGVLKNPELETALLAFAPFVLFSIPSHHFNHYLVVLDRIPSAMALTLAFEGGKTLIILGGYYFFHSLDVVLWGMGGLALCRTAVMATWNFRARKQWRFPSPALFEQIRFALPLGGSNLMSLALKLDRFIVSSLFGLRAFTIYSVGCFEVPLMENTVTTMADLMSFDMVEARAKGDLPLVQSLWRDTLRKITIFHVPLAVYFVFFASEVIRFIYSDTYAESAAYFIVFTGVFMLPSFTPEVVFRVFAKNTLLLRIRLFAAVYSLALIFGFAYAYGPFGALIGKLVADIFTAGIQLQSMRLLLETSWKRLLPWKEIVQVTAFSCLSAYGLHSLFAFRSLFVTLGLSILLHTLSVIGLCLLVGFFRPEEIAYVRGKINFLNS